jgi:hypothetical protein
MSGVTMGLHPKITDRNQPLASQPFVGHPGLRRQRTRQMPVAVAGSILGVRALRASLRLSKIVPDDFVLLIAVRIAWRLPVPSASKLRTSRT